MNLINENENLTIRNCFIGVVCFIAVFTLKKWYQGSTISDLYLILKANSILTGAVTGEIFSYVKGAGFSGMGGSILITRECSGMNFLIISLSLSIYISLFLNTGNRRFFPVFITNISAALFIAIIANVSRISSSIFLMKLSSHAFLVKYKSEIHLIEGVFIYLIFLIILYFISVENRLNLFRFKGFGN